MALSGGAIVAIVVIVVVVILIIIFGVLLILYFWNKSKNTALNSLVSSNNNNNTTNNCADFRPVVLTKCDLEKFCDLSDSCSGFSLPPVGGKCKSLSKIDISCSDKDCFESESCSSVSDSESCSVKNKPCNKNRCDKGKCDKGKSISCESLETVESSESCESVKSCDKSKSCAPCDMKFDCNAKDYYSAQDLKVVEFCNLEPNKILDITDDSRFIYALQKGGTSITIKSKSKKTQCKITSKITLQRILTFQNTILGVSSGKLYQQDPSSVGRMTWYWFLLNQIPTGITWITKTLDGKYLWIQTADKGYLYNAKLNQVSTMDINKNIQRFFGTSPEIIGDLNTSNHELTLVNCGKKFINVGVAVFDPSNAIVYVRPQFLSTVKGIRIIRGKPYYLIN